MKYKKITNKSKTRAQFSNPNHGIPHEELLKKAGVKKFTDFDIENLSNGMIRIIPKKL